MPAPGTAVDGLPCPAMRGFDLIDQDQSGNVTTEYSEPGGQAGSAGRRHRHWW